MKLNINSINARLYRWFYATERMPQSLCPYFWKLVIMWIFILPYTILSLPTILNDLNDPYNTRSTGERVAIGVSLYFILFMLISMLSWIGIFFAEPVKDSLWFHLLCVGFMCWLSTIVVGGLIFFKWIRDKWQNRHIRYDEDGYRIWQEPKQKQPSIILEFIKASYNKYCPKIDWDYKK